MQLGHVRESEKDDSVIIRDPITTLDITEYINEYALIGKVIANKDYSNYFVSYKEMYRMFETYVLELGCERFDFFATLFARLDPGEADTNNSLCRQCLAQSPNMANIYDIIHMLKTKISSQYHVDEYEEMIGLLQVFHHLVSGYFQHYCRLSDHMYYAYDYESYATMISDLDKIVIKCVCSEGFAGPDGMPYHFTELSKNVTYLKHVEKKLLGQGQVAKWNDKYFNKILENLGIGQEIDGNHKHVLYHQEYLPYAKMIALKISVMSRHGLFMSSFIDGINIALGKLNEGIEARYEDAVDHLLGKPLYPFAYYKAADGSGVDVPTDFGQSAFLRNMNDCESEQEVEYLFEKCFEKPIELFVE
jgi:hypothetical protein